MLCKHKAAVQYYLQDIRYTGRHMTKVGPELGEIRQNVGTVLERQVFASANYCPPLRFFLVTGQDTVFRRGTFRRVIGVLLVFLGCPLIKVR